MGRVLAKTCSLPPVWLFSSCMHASTAPPRQASTACCFENRAGICSSKPSTCPSSNSACWPLKVTTDLFAPHAAGSLPTPKSEPSACSSVTCMAEEPTACAGTSRAGWDRRHVFSCWAAAGAHQGTRLVQGDDKRGGGGRAVGLLRVGHDEHLRRALLAAHAEELHRGVEGHDGHVHAVAACARIHTACLGAQLAG